MGLFDFFKPKKSAIEEMFERMNNSTFPKGEKDIDACVDELLRILGNKISREEAKNIVLKSVFISRMSLGDKSDPFTIERLRAHLAPYALHHFNDEQLMHFWGYLIGIYAIMLQDRKTPSEIKWDGSKYAY